MISKRLSTLIIASALALGPIANRASADPVAGAAIGAGAGALVGHAVSGRDGALVGGALGGVAGYQLGKRHSEGNRHAHGTRPVRAYQSQYRRPVTHYHRTYRAPRHHVYHARSHGHRAALTTHRVKPHVRYYRDQYGQLVRVNTVR